MKNLETLIESSLLNKNLYADNRHIFAFQIEPAIHYILRNLLLKYSENETLISESHNSDQRLKIIKEKKLVKEDLIYEITHIFEVTKKVKKLPFVNDSSEIVEIERLLENADQYLLQLKMILEEIISTNKKKIRNGK